MIILGIDPGLAIVGWGVLEYHKGAFRVMGYGSIQTKAGLPVEERIKQIYDSMNIIIDKYKPEVMAIEELFWNTNQTTGIRVAEARGVILLAAHLKGVRCFEYTPLQVKSSVVGYGKATKHQVMDMTKRLLNLPQMPKPDDAADAIALALCHARSSTSLLANLK